jgi:hypothetical protein
MDIQVFDFESVYTPPSVVGGSDVDRLSKFDCRSPSDSPMTTRATIVLQK